MKWPPALALGAAALVIAPLLAWIGWELDLIRHDLRAVALDLFHLPRPLREH